MIARIDGEDLEELGFNNIWLIQLLNTSMWCKLKHLFSFLIAFMKQDHFLEKVFGFHDFTLFEFLFNNFLLYLIYDTDDT